MQQQEIWKNIKGFPGYQVSNTGRVRSINKKNKTGDGIYYLSAIPHQLGYVRARLVYQDGAQTTKYIHRLVAEAFLPKPRDDKDYTVNHIDGCKDNNHVNNLEWLTHRDNIKHFYKTNGVRKIGPLLTDEQKEKILQLCRDGVKRKEIAKKYKKSVGYVYRLAGEAKRIKESEVN